MTTTIRRRLERLFMQATGSDTSLGTLAWSARQLSVSKATIYSWVAGRRNPTPLAYRTIELLEILVEVSRDGDVNPRRYLRMKPNE